jgi:RNA polymerase sigma factor (sigma-70 family)
MATNQMSEVIQHLRRTVLPREEAGLTDRQLLKDYINRREEAAMAALVRRHGPMVWGVCRRVLGNYHDAEDAFQATFLVLVRKAASIASPQLLANWLYGVAHQTALKARATTAKRRARERQVTQMPEPAVTEQDLWNDLQPLLDQELSRLPDKYRVAIVLCQLEGRTRKEAARHLGVPEGTLAARLARGRVMLAKRLARHGLAVSGGSLAAVLAQNAASASPPISVVVSTIKAAGLFAAGQAAAAGALSAKVAALTEGVLKTMFMTKLKIATLVLLTLALLGSGIGMLTLPAVAEQEGAKKGATEPPVQEAKAPKIERPKKLARILDPSPELRRELSAFDAYRHGSEEKFVELERKADELLKKYTAPDDQARIYFEVAHVAAQSNIGIHVKRVRRYAGKSLALSRDPLQRGWLYSYLGSAAEGEAEKTFDDCRRQAAKELLTGYAEMLAQELPAKAPELPAVDKLGGEGFYPTPVEAAQAFARHAAQMGARQEAEFVGELVHRRDTLANQLRWLYHPHPKIHGRNPDGPEELRALARKVLNDPKAVEALLARVTEQ